MDGFTGGFIHGNFSDGEIRYRSNLFVSKAGSAEIAAFDEGNSRWDMVLYIPT